MPAAYIADRVLETSTTTGTGAFTLDGAVTGYQTFLAAIGVSGGSVNYLIEAVDADGVPTGDWETGIGTFDGVDQLTRDVQWASSGGPPTSFSAGTKRVYLAAVAKQLGTIGATAIKSADLTAQDFTTATTITFNTDFGGISFDTDSFHDTVTNAGRMTVPASWSDDVVTLSAQVALLNISADQWVKLFIRQNGSTIVAQGTFETGDTSPAYQIVSSPIWCNGGDYFELRIQVESDTTVDIDHTRTWFHMRVEQ